MHDSLDQDGEDRWPMATSHISNVIAELTHLSAAIRLSSLNWSKLPLIAGI
jgi:hypothetical protein